MKEGRETGEGFDPPGGGLGQPHEDESGPAGILVKLALASFPFLFLLLLLVLEWWIRGRS